MLRSTAWLHGFSVWCTATVGGVLLVALGAGALLGGLSKIVGGGLSAVGQPMAAMADGATDLAANAVKQSEATIESFVDEAVSTRTEADAENEDIRAKREVGFAISRLFNPAQAGDTEINRKAAVTALVDHTEMNQTEADRAVTKWTQTYEQLQNDLAAFQETAAKQAREAADAAADGLATFSLWSFFGFLLGALAATWGGCLGAKCATRCTEGANTGRYAHRTSDQPNQEPDTKH